MIGIILRTFRKPVTVGRDSDLTNTFDSRDGFGYVEKLRTQRWFSACKTNFPKSECCKTANKPTDFVD